ncbi:SusC/RagA family TonB-linked outer membrane protein [Bacteroidia bacterium]|nr:SusC/RagA family TonB-linked outer membrane protein [Bacteroidia bacterium]
MCTFQLVALNLDAQILIKLQANNLSVKELITEIEKQTDYLVLFRNNDVDVSRIVNVKDKSEPLTSLLEDAFRNTDVNYEFQYKYIVLTKDKIAVANLNKQQQSGKLITGTVTDPSGEPIIGANVVEKGTTNGVITDTDGKFSLNVSSNAVLQISYIGSVTQEIAVGNRTRIDVTLKEETFGLDEVVVIGYGTTTRQNFTGAVANVKIEDSPAALTSTSNVLNLLNGTVAGINLNKSGSAGAGQAGSNPSMLIRGQKSISIQDESSTNPLFVVDGIIFNGTLNDIDVNSIEEVTVLKDASTLATYGTRAANGVLMITTKKGKQGKPVINFNPSIAISSPNFRPKMRDAQGFNELMNRRAGLPADADPTWMTDLERANYNAGKTTDWLDYITRTGVTQNYSLSFSGATDNSNYYLSAGHWDQKGMYYGDNYQRNTFAARVNTIINKYIDLGANVNLAFNSSDGTRPSYGQAVFLTPFGEPELKNGNMRKFVDGKETTTTNPLWNTFNGVDHEVNGSTVVLGGFLNIKIPKVEGLSYKITGSYTKVASDTRHFVHESNFPEISLGDNGYTTEIFDSHLRDANGYQRTNGVSSWVLDNIVTYYRTIENHYINATLVYTRDAQTTDNTYITASDYRGVGNTLLGFYGLNNADVQKISTYNNQLTNMRKSNIGYLGRLNYSYNNKYHLNFAVRRDGSSVFGKSNKWGTFPSIGGAWTVSSESFMKDMKQIDNLKLKLSWGKNGNQSLVPYSTLSPVNMGRGGNQVYYLGGNVAYAQQITALGNATLGWEETASLNYGFETDLFSRRLHADVSIYSSATTNQIFSRRIPPMGSGLTQQRATMGQVNNKGVEATFSGILMKKKDFTWNAGLIFTLNRNKLVDLYGDGQDDITNNLFIGKSLGAIYGYVWDGIVQKGNENYVSNLVATPGDAKYADLNGDGQLTADDRKILGYSKENFRMSMTHTFSYKNFNLYLLINSTFGGHGYGMEQNNSAYLTDDTYYNHNTLDHPYWTPENLSDKYPRWSFMDNRFRALQAYTFVRLQDLNLSYTFSNNLLNKVGVTGLKLYLSGTNLFFYAPEWVGSDPEVRGYNYAQLQRTFTFGLNFKF